MPASASTSWPRSSPSGRPVDWLARLDEADVPCAPVLRRGEVASNEQVVARGLIYEFDHPGIGRVRQAGRPAAQFSATPVRAPSPAPALGEHWAG